MDEPNSEPSASDEREANPDSSGQLSLWPVEPAANAPEHGTPAGSSTEKAHAESLPIPPEPDPPWTLLDLGSFIVFACVSFVIANVVALAAFAMLKRSLSWRVSTESVFAQTPGIILLQAAWEMMWLAYIYLTVSKKYQRRFWEALKWVSVPGQPWMYLAAGAGLAFGAQLVFSFFPSQKHLPVEKLFSNTESAYLLAFLGICIAPFIEELVFRGFFYPVFERMWGLAVAVVLTGVLFAAIHMPQLRGGWGEIASIFVVGMAFSYCRGRTGSLRASFLMHFAYNVALFVSLYFSTDRFRNFQGLSASGP